MATQGQREDRRGERRKHGDNVDRPLHLVRLRLEIELVTAADLSARDLAINLAQLATAGLHGMVLDLVRVELDGTRVPEAEQIVRYPGDARRIRPAPDQRLVAAAYDLDKLADDVFRALGIRRTAGGGVAPVAEADS